MVMGIQLWVANTVEPPYPLLHKTPPLEGGTLPPPPPPPSPTQRTLHHWQRAFSAQLPLMLHLLLLPLQTKHLSLAVRQHRCQRQLAFLDPSSRISAGIDSERSVLSPAPASTLTNKCALWKDSTKMFSKFIIALPPLLQVVMWPKVQKA